VGSDQSLLSTSRCLRTERCRTRDRRQPGNGGPLRSLGGGGSRLSPSPPTVREEKVDHPGPPEATIPGSLETTHGRSRRRAAGAGHPSRLSIGPSLVAAPSRCSTMGHVDVWSNTPFTPGPGAWSASSISTSTWSAPSSRRTVVAQLVMIKAILPSMLERGGGTIRRHHLRRGTTDPPRRRGRRMGLGYRDQGGVPPRGGILRGRARPSGDLRRQCRARLCLPNACCSLSSGSALPAVSGSTTIGSRAVVAWLGGARGSHT